MELLVVIGLIAVLASILLPVINTAHAQSDSMKCSANLRQLGAGISSYSGDHEGRLPGPLNPLIYPAFSTQAEEADALVKFIGPYIGIAPTTAGTTRKVETVTTCPAFVSFVKGEQLPSYVLNFADKLPDLNQAPWGDATGNAPPVLLSVLTAWRETKTATAKYEPSPTGQKNLTRVWAIKDADKDSFRDMPVASANGLPNRPVHGDYRNALFYDWHVGKIDLDDNPK
jgi:prepilin-type processing-associated H-X9-DG protein